MTHSTVEDLLARRIAQLESDRDHWERMYRRERMASRVRAVCVCWLTGDAGDSVTKALALDDEDLEIVAHQCTDEVYREMRERGLVPKPAEE